MMMMKKDNVVGCKEVPPKKVLNTTSNPSYYKLGGIEPFEYMKSKMTPEEFQGYLKCNIIKYVSRMGHKINNHDDETYDNNKLLSTYDDACKIRKYADTLCKEVFKALPNTLQIKYAEEDEWMDIKEDNK